MLVTVHCNIGNMFIAINYNFCLCLLFQVIIFYVEWIIMVFGVYITIKYCLNALYYLLIDVKSFFVFLAKIEFCLFVYYYWLFVFVFLSDLVFVIWFLFCIWLNKVLYNCFEYIYFLIVIIVFLWCLWLIVRFSFVLI